MTQHLDSDQLADLQEGLLDPAAATAAARHLDSCETCRRVADDLVAVTAALAAAPPADPMPADVVARLDAAFAAEHARGRGRAREAAPTSELPGARPSEAPDVIPLPVPATRRWWADHRVLQAAAVAVLLMAGGAAVLPTLHNAADTAATSSAERGATDADSPASGDTQDELAGAPSAGEPPTRILATGEDYDRASLSEQVLDLLATPAASRSATSEHANTARLLALNDPAAVAACVAALPAAAPKAVLVDNARFNGRSAAIVAVEAVAYPELVQIFVVDPACSARDPQILHQETVPRR